MSEIEHIDVPRDMMRKLSDLAKRRAWPLMAEAIAYDRPIKQAVRDIYCQGLADGYDAGRAALEE